MPFVIRKLEPVVQDGKTIYRPGTFFAGWCDPKSGLYTTIGDRQYAFIFSYRPDAEACRDRLTVVSEGEFLVETLHGRGSAEIPRKIDEMLQRRCLIARELDRINSDLNEWLVLHDMRDHNCGALMGDNTVYSDPYTALRESRLAIESMLIDRLVNR